MKSEGAGNQNTGEIPYETPVRCAMCFICRPKAKEGALLIDKCVEKGVPPGPLLGQLKAGHDVTLPNGTVVLAKDVRSPDCLGPVFIGDFWFHTSMSGVMYLYNSQILLLVLISCRLSHHGIYRQSCYQSCVEEVL